MSDSSLTIYDILHNSNNINTQRFKFNKNSSFK